MTSLALIPILVLMLSIIEWLGLSRDLATLAVDRLFAGSPGAVDRVMGVVDGCGEGAEGWKGMRVVALAKQASGGFAEYAICPPESAFEMPDEIPLPDAAALYFPFHLAWLGLFDRADLQPGESVLIHAAAGGAGSAAIQPTRTTP